jgi:hypothetical protein
LFLASAPARARLAGADAPQLASADPVPMLAYLESSVLAALAPGAPNAASRKVSR